MTIIKICSIPGCNRKHHAKGYCAEHYRKFVLVGHYENTKCSVDGCNKPISYHFSKDRLCEMHGTRLKRNGDVNVRQKERDTKSYAENIINSIFDELGAEYMDEAREIIRRTLDPERVDCTVAKRGTDYLTTFNDGRRLGLHQGTDGANEYRPHKWHNVDYPQSLAVDLWRFYELGTIYA